MATRPLPSLDWPSLLSRAYMFFSEKLQPRKSKWAELTAMSRGYSMFSTCTQEPGTENKRRQASEKVSAAPSAVATAWGINKCAKDVVQSNQGIIIVKIK